MEDWKLQALRKLSDLQQLLLFPEEEAMHMQLLASDKRGTRIPLREELWIRLGDLADSIWTPEQEPAPVPNHFALDDAVENLVTQLQNYESDTFSASEAGLDRDEAEAMAAHLIRTTLFDEAGMPGDGIDGAVVGHAWDVVQEALQAQIDSL